MMRHHPSLDLVRLHLRQHVCRTCQWRPKGSERFGPDVARSCEAGCTVFRHLPVLVQTARLMDPMLRSPELTLQHRIADLCKGAQRSSGTGGCPLARYQAEVAKVVAKAFDR